MSKKSRRESGKKTGKESDRNHFIRKRTYLIVGLSPLLKELKGHEPNKAFAAKLKFSERTLFDIEKNSAISEANWSKVQQALKEYSERLVALCPEGWGGNSQSVSGGPKWPSKLSKRLRAEVESFHVPPQLQESVISVMAHKDFPKWMHVGGKPLLNPVWKDSDIGKINRVRELYGGPKATAPRVMRADVHLMKRTDEMGRGELLTYRSPDWKTNFIHFRPWLLGQEPGKRDFLNRGKLSMDWKVPFDSVSITPLPGMFVVSAKLHEKYEDLFLYIFELCSVRFNTISDKLKMLLNEDPDHAGSGRWRSLTSLRSDADSCKKDGDLVRGVHEFFEDSLASLPDSFNSSEIEKTLRAPN